MKQEKLDKNVSRLDRYFMALQLSILSGLVPRDDSSVELLEAWDKVRQCALPNQTKKSPSKRTNARRLRTKRRV